MDKQITANSGKKRQKREQLKENGLETKQSESLRCLL